MSDVDNLLLQAENVAEALRNRLPQVLTQAHRRHGPEDFRALGGELRKITQFYQRRLAAGASDPEGEVLNLLVVGPPDRGKARQYWQTLSDVLKPQLPALRQRYKNGKDVAFILGWVFRLLR